MLKMFENNVTIYIMSNFFKIFNELYENRIKCNKSPNFGLLVCKQKHFIHRFQEKRILVYV